MGGSWSSLEREPSPDPWWPSEQLGPTTDVKSNERASDKPGTTVTKGRVREEELEAFKEELARKRVLRHEAIAAVQAELKELRGRAENERKLREEAEEERDKLRTLLENRTREDDVLGKQVEEESQRSKHIELKAETEQTLNEMEENLRAELKKEREEKNQLLEERDWLRAEAEEKLGLQRQVQALKDVSEIGKEMLKIRELQVKELKKKLVEMNISSVMAPPEDLRVEYEKQIENIRKLRTLYEERAAATSLEHRRELEREEARITVLETKLRELQKETDEVKEIKKELEDKIEQLENSIQFKENELETAKDDLFSTTVQNKSLNSQIALVNNLFSHMLISPKVDLDRLTRLLQENHDLIKDLTVKGDSNEVAALLVDLAGQVEREQSSDEKQKDKVDEDATESNISSNLTKVWKVLIELLSYHENAVQTEPAGGAESCYKCVQTPSGPRSVISVSQTFLTLKDLILEKNKLMKEVGRLKTLNNHLENRLGNQEKRLSVVTLELRKTWGVVNKLKAQHKQLHTHEKILRYELHQKRCMLTELKQELELCRDKWDLAREKNSQTEEDWKKLRKEFASRKTRKESNSAESGYEEDDVAHSPPSEPINQEELFKLGPPVTSEPELSEDDIEHSDGNSFDTVIDLLDIAYLENPSERQSAVPFVLCEVSPEVSEISPSLLPLTSSEFTDGLDQIESEDLAAVLDAQYQNQLLGADYNLSLPSSSGSSPIPTENDDFASSEMDVSEEDSSSNSNNLFSSPSLTTTNQTSSNNSLLFGSNSSRNISKFLDGLFYDSQQAENIISIPKNLTLNVHSTSVPVNENDTATPIVSEDNCSQFSPGSSTPMVTNGNSFEFPSNQEDLVLPTSSVNTEAQDMEHVQKWVIDSQTTSLDGSSKQQSLGEKSVEVPSEARSQEEILRAREDRLKRLEYQCRSLVNKVTSTSFRSEIISNKLDELHLSYGPSDDVLDISKQSSTNMVTSESQVSEHKDLEQSSERSITPSGHTSDSSMVCPKTKSTEEQETSSSSSGSPSQSSSPVQTRTPEQILEARAARLKRLEDQCKSLFCKMSATSSRSEVISNKLDELHESYGGPERADIGFSKKSLLLNNSTSLESQHNESVAACSTTCSNVEKLDVATDFKTIQHDCSTAGPSSVPTADPRKGRTPEQMLEARAERFKRLEDQCKSLVTQMTATSLRSELISNKLDKLHSSYGSSEGSSDNEENPFSSREGRKRSTPSSSPSYSRKLAQLAERKNETVTATSSSIDESTCRLPLDSVTLPIEPNLPPQKIIIENTNVPVSSQVATLQEKSKTTNLIDSGPKDFIANSETSNSVGDRLQEHTSVQVCPLVTDFNIPSNSFETAVATANNSSNENETSQTIDCITTHREAMLLNSESKNASDKNKNTT